MNVTTSGAVRETGASQLLDDFARAHPQSPSGVDTYRDCQRKWAFRKLDKVQKPPNKYAQRGTDVHDVLERWLRDATPPPKTDAGKIATAGLRHLPLPKTGLVEGAGKLFTFEGLRAVYNGKKDWRTDRLMPLAIGGVETGLARVFDHKSTTNFKWAKTAEELKKDVQSNLYAVHEIVSYPDREPVVEENWVYYRANPKKPGSLRVVLNVVPDGVPMVLPVPDGVEPGYFGMMRYSELWQRFEEIELDAAAMLEHIRNHRKAKELPYNIEICNKYGGCPYRGDPCKLSMGEIIRGHMAQEQKETIAEKIRRQLAERKGNGGAAPATAGATAGAAAAPAKQDASAEGKALASQPLSSGTAAAVQESLPAVNPPDLSGQPKIYVAVKSEDALMIAQGIVAARIFNEFSPSYAQDVAKLAVSIVRENLLLCYLLSQTT